jgi:serine phosphatase RsbU (regulator of sigma subunit)/catechol 2,3-dioxygenase-like lactoylglutathione lyase family enzyme
MASSAEAGDHGGGSTLNRQQSHLRVHAINIFVRDQDRSLRFYIDQLGFTPVGDVCFESGERWVAVAPPDGTTVLSLVTPKPGSREEGFIGHPTQVVFVTEDVVGKYGEWLKRGVRFQYAPRLKRIRYGQRATRVGSNDTSKNSRERASLWGGVMTHFRDPDGNSFALVSYDEETQAVEEQRRAAAARLEAERRAAQELEIAKQVQTRLFPQTLPPRATLDYYGACIQARHVGGDYYDFLDLGREWFGFVIADVSGKGMPAALLMANLQANLRSQCAIASDQPQQFLQMVNHLFFENSTDSAYATLFFAEYDQPGRRLRYVNCGHLPGLLLRRDGTLERLQSTCTVLGLFAKWNCSTRDVPFCPGDMLALYTDGITEAFNDQGEEFGEQRLIQSLRLNPEERSLTLVSSILNEVGNFSPQEQFDDRTLIIAKCQ